jgi:hypothetical protein
MNLKWDIPFLSRNITFLLLRLYLRLVSRPLTCLALIVNGDPAIRGADGEQSRFQGTIRGNITVQL